MKDKALGRDEIHAFRKRVYDFFGEQGRRLPWRETGDPYHIVVSEVMLQQTQVDRVIEKYRHFIATFPDWATLARAPLEQVLGAWQGLGYNRRALLLKNAAIKVMKDFNGALPEDPGIILNLPGIGKATSSSIAAFAFNRPVVFVETNIRTIFIFHFFYGRVDVHDEEILPLVAETLDVENPRLWYSALMDYGTMLKKVHGNLSRRSRHYMRQSPFEGSDRQIRGRIIKTLLQETSLTPEELIERIRDPQGRVPDILERLSAEGMVVREKGLYRVG